MKQYNLAWSNLESITHRFSITLYNILSDSKLMLCAIIIAVFFTPSQLKQLMQ